MKHIPNILSCFRIALSLVLLILLFLTLPVGLLAGGFPLWLLLPLGIAALLSSLEETLILLTSSNYEVNRKSILFKWRSE